MSTTICMLAESDIWSELFSLLVIFLLVSVPAIIRKLAEKAKSLQQKDRESDKLRYTGPAKPKRGRGAVVSEWDRRQELIRERLKQLQERQSLYKDQVKPEQPQQRPVTAEIPVRQVPAEKPSVQTRIPASSGIPQYVNAAGDQRTTPHTQAPAFIKIPPPPARQKAAQRQTKRTGGISTIETIIRTASPLKAGIILKEILDRPRAIRFDLDIY